MTKTILDWGFLAVAALIVLLVVIGSLGCLR